MLSEKSISLNVAKYLIEYLNISAIPELILMLGSLTIKESWIGLMWGL